MYATEPMEWVTINDDGIEMEAINFLDGALVRDPLRTGLAFCQGWQVMNRGDMDGPALRPRKERQKVFGIEIVEVK